MDHCLHRASGRYQLCGGRGGGVSPESSAVPGQVYIYGKSMHDEIVPKELAVDFKTLKILTE